MKPPLLSLFVCVVASAVVHAADPGWVEDAVIEQAKRAIVTIERVGAGNEFAGFFASEDGLVVTLAMEIEGIKEVAIHTAAGERITGSRLVALDQELDIAIFATGQRAPAFLVMHEKPVAWGETCAVVFPWDSQIKVADGVLLARREELDRSATRFRIEWSMALNAASEARNGSPVITSDGRVAGIHLGFRMKLGAIPQRFAFARPEVAISAVLARAREARAALAFPRVSGGVHDLSASADPEFIDGVNLMNSGDSSRAIPKFRSVHVTHPHSPMVMEHLAGALFAADDLARARAAAEEAVGMAPERLNLRSMLGMIIGRQGDTAKTTGYFQVMAAKFPKYGDAWEGLGNSHWFGGRKDEALAAYRKCTELEPEAILAWQNYHAALSAAGNLTEAAKARQRANELEHLYFKLKYSAPHRD